MDVPGSADSCELAEAPGTEIRLGKCILVLLALIVVRATTRQVRRLPARPELEMCQGSERRNKAGHSNEAIQPPLAGSCQPGTAAGGDGQLQLHVMVVLVRSIVTAVAIAADFRVSYL